MPLPYVNFAGTKANSPHYKIWYSVYENEVPRGVQQYWYKLIKKLLVAFGCLFPLGLVSLFLIQVFASIGLHIHSLAHAASGYHRVLEENRKLYNQVQDLKGNKIISCLYFKFHTCLNNASPQNG